MGFVESVRTVLSKYAVFSGRARRSEYWWFALFALVVGIIARAVDAAAGTSSSTGSGVVSGLLGLALLLPSLGVAVRRLHDTGRSGWWVLIGLVPLVGFIVLLVFYVSDSAPGSNRFGASPKGSAPAGYGYPSQT